jgi:F-type H+-transporting ATPase subunit a
MDISLAPKTLFTIAGFDVTNSFFVTVMISFLLIVLFWLATRKPKSVPKGIQFWAEVIIMEGYKFIRDIAGSEEKAKKMFPFIMTMFLVFLFANFLPFIPGISAITYNDVPIHRTATSDYTLAFSLAILSIIIVQIITLITGGFWVYFTKFFTFKGENVGMRFINAFLGIMDIISELAKIVSLSFRLFGNMFAAEILAAVIIGLVPYILPVPFALLGVLTALIQAAVFSILVLIFMSMAVVEKEYSQQQA